MTNANQKYLLLIIQFTYTGELSCLWPIYFDISPANAFGNKEMAYFDAAMDELKTYPGISNVRIVHKKIATFTECEETFKSVLQTSAEDNLTKLSYLRLQQQRIMSEKPQIDYRTNETYLTIKTQAMDFPVRLRSHQFPFLLDDIELPVVVFEVKDSND